MGKHLVFVGGGHAHLTSLVNIGDHIKFGSSGFTHKSGDASLLLGHGPGTPLGDLSS